MAWCVHGVFGPTVCVIVLLLFLLLLSWDGGGYTVYSGTCEAMGSEISQLYTGGRMLGGGADLRCHCMLY